jgi:hypothetical protein
MRFDPLTGIIHGGERKFHDESDGNANALSRLPRGCREMGIAS